jgi:putative ATP-dependent endonuclease of OLD family
VYLSRVEFAGFRHLSDPVDFARPLSILVGPNNSGKSSVIDALRMTLPPLSGWPLRPRRSDFVLNGAAEITADEFTITTRFADLTVTQAGRMLTALDGRPDRAALCLRSTLPEVGAPKRMFMGGESMTSDVEEWARTAVTYTYLPPLRDAEEDMKPGRANRLVELVASLTGTGPDHARIVGIAEEANAELAKVDAIKKATERIQTRLNEIHGASHAQQADLLFSDPVFERVLSTLGVRIGDMQPLELGFNGLGLNNVLYIAVLLAGLTYEPESDLHLLLVEEPEAHLHPQLQDLLMRFLQREVERRDDVQVIVTSHSPNLASAAPAECITVMSRLPSRIASGSVGQFGLKSDEVDHLARFLDVTKASLLFARSIILVEGLAEQLLMPLLAAECGKSLAEAGVTVVNVGGLAFGPFAALYDDERLPHRCAIVSDADPPDAEDDDDPGQDDDLQADVDEKQDSTVDQENQDPPVVVKAGHAEMASGAEMPDPVLSATAQKLKAAENKRRKVFLSDKTFEYDLVMAGNWDWALQALALIKPRVAKRLGNDATLTTHEAKAEALLIAVKAVKGRFAQALTKTLAPYKSAGNEIKVPQYIADAVEWTVAMGAPLAMPSTPPLTAHPATREQATAQDRSETPASDG